MLVVRGPSGAAKGREEAEERGEDQVRAVGDDDADDGTCGACFEHIGLQERIICRFRLIWGGGGGGCGAGAEV